MFYSFYWINLHLDRISPLTNILGCSSLTVLHCMGMHASTLPKQTQGMWLQTSLTFNLSFLIHNGHWHCSNVWWSVYFHILTWWSELVRAEYNWAWAHRVNVRYTWDKPSLNLHWEIGFQWGFSAMLELWPFTDFIQISSVNVHLEQQLCLAV